MATFSNPIVIGIVKVRIFFEGSKVIVTNLEREVKKY